MEFLLGEACVQSQKSTLPGGVAEQQYDYKTAKAHDQFFTTIDVAEECVDAVLRFVRPNSLMVEPSAGEGAFFCLLPGDRIGYDPHSTCPGVIPENFFEIDLPEDRDIVVIGNPPFGRQCKLAIAFFNHAARRARIIAFIMPMSIRKAAAQNKLDLNYHPVFEKVLQKNAFTFMGKPYHVPTVFQIWERRDYQREPRVLFKSHPDFDFTKDGAAFTIRRIGSEAGRIFKDRNCIGHDNLFVKPKRPEVLEIMLRLDLKPAAGNAVGPKNISQGEIIELYSIYVSEHGYPDICISKK